MPGSELSLTFWAVACSPLAVWAQESRSSLQLALGLTWQTLCWSSTFARSVVSLKATVLEFSSLGPGIWHGDRWRVQTRRMLNQSPRVWPSTKTAEVHEMSLKPSTRVSLIGPARLLGNKGWRVSFKAVGDDLPEDTGHGGTR